MISLTIDPDDVVLNTVDVCVSPFSSLPIHSPSSDFIFPIISAWRASEAAGTTRGDDEPECPASPFDEHPNPINTPTNTMSSRFIGFSFRQYPLDLNPYFKSATFT